MNFFDKLSRGWDISLNSFKVLKENKKLIIFPILSGISMIVLTLSFLVAIFSSVGFGETVTDERQPVFYIGVFVFYVINYFIVVFFNTALIHCATLYFKGERPTVRAGLQFSKNRVGAIFAWAVFAATVGYLLRILQENLGFAGKLVTGIIGIVWNVATFFAVPVMIYEHTNPIQSVKRSAQIMKEKWGESLGAGFSFGIIRLLSVFLVGGLLFAVGFVFHVLAGVVLAVMGVLLVIAVLNASETIFVAAMYNNVTGDPVKHFDEQFVDNLFVHK